MFKDLDIRIAVDHTIPDIQVSSDRHPNSIRMGIGNVWFPSNAARIEIGTTDEWNERTQYIPREGFIIVYSDRNVVDGVAYPGVKIGDGNAYLIDLPFVGDDVASNIIMALEAHINDSQMHISEEERQKWNNKINYELNETKETLVINRE